VVHAVWVGGLHFSGHGGRRDADLSSAGVSLALAALCGNLGRVRDDCRDLLDQKICGQTDQSIGAGRSTVKAKIHVTLKQGILDPQGKAIEHALDSLGFKHVANVRVGKYMEVDVNETDKAKAEVQVKQMCEKLLANTIIEEYRYELTGQ
jgi:phosphoribosylformylglycinamidine synthase subunit PurS